jgi:hypothetical protein
VAGPAPPFGDTHLDHPLGLGPGLPLNIHGLPPNDPLVSPWFRQSTISREIQLARPLIQTSVSPFPYSRTQDPSGCGVGHRHS